MQSDIADSTTYGSPQRSRRDSSPLVMLPAPLVVNNRPGISNSQSTTTMFSRNNEEVSLVGDTGSRARLIPSPTCGDYSSAYGSSEGYAQSPEPYSRPPAAPIESYVNRAGYGANGSTSGAVLRQSTVSSA